MLAAMSETPDLEFWQQLARCSGFEWSVADLEPIQATLEQVRATLAELHRLPLKDVEPTVQYRVL
jgi:hypothetical protein